MHTTSRVAEAGISFPTDLENNMTARPFKPRVPLIFPRHNPERRFHSELAMQKHNTLRVLYIEDHDDTRELVTLLLEQRKYEVVTGSTRETGVALAGSQQFDLYLLPGYRAGRVWSCAGRYVSLIKPLRSCSTQPPLTRSIKRRP